MFLEGLLLVVLYTIVYGILLHKYLLKERSLKRKGGRKEGGEKYSEINSTREMHKGLLFGSRHTLTHTHIYKYKPNTHLLFRSVAPEKPFRKSSAHPENVSIFRRLSEKAYCSV